MSDPLITLLTDFGVKDAYVAQMKGQILAICPAARIIDVTHALPPQDVVYAGLVLAQSAPYFPAGSIHVAVVDPGVGTPRRLIAVEMDTRTDPLTAACRQRFVLPDNGLIGRLAKRFEIVAATALSEKKYWRERVSSTFHGRDIMGPVAGHWAAGVDRREFGPPVNDVEIGSWPEPLRELDKLRGEIIALDHFGNAITNLPADWFEKCHPANVSVLFGGQPIALQVAKTYGEHPAGTAILLVGSHEMFEIAVVGGSAAEQLRLSRGAPVEIRMRKAVLPTGQSS